MKTYAMALDLVDDVASIEQYKEFHLEVWPEVKEVLISIGIEEMRIFLSWTNFKRGWNFCFHQCSRSKFFFEWSDCPAFDRLRFFYFKNPD